MRNRIKRIQAQLLMNLATDQGQSGNNISCEEFCLIIFLMANSWISWPKQVPSAKHWRYRLQRLSLVSPCKDKTSSVCIHMYVTVLHMQKIKTRIRQMNYDSTIYGWLVSEMCSSWHVDTKDRGQCNDFQGPSTFFVFCCSTSDGTYVNYLSNHCSKGDIDS